jgi:hypothetical protein
MAFKVWVSCESKDRNRVALPVEEQLSPETKENYQRSREKYVFTLDNYCLKVPAGYVFLTLFIA